MFRKTLFWTHLVCGVLAGLVVLMMSFTGVLLTYERQILAWAEFRNYEAPESGGEKLPLEALIASATSYDPGFEPSSVQVFSDPGKPVVLSAGRSGQLILDPYTGEVVEADTQALEAFFSSVTGWHRWFNTSGDSRGAARAITGASNLMFLFLVISGLYLWFPAFWNWASFRSRMLFRSGPMTSKARDFNWHHVLGFWSAIPLIVVVATASVFYYGWANNLVYGVFGETPPTRGGAAQAAQQESLISTPASSSDPLAMDRLVERASQQLDDWQSISVSLPTAGDSSTHFTLDQGDGGQPQLRHSLELNSYTGEVETWAPFSSRTPGQQARSWVRFLHTGEALGVMGQTIAGLVSLFSVVLVYTGLALAYRRLAQPLLRKSAS